MSVKRVPYYIVFLMHLSNKTRFRRTMMIVLYYKNVNNHPDNCMI